MGPALSSGLEQNKNQAEYMKQQFEDTGHQAVKGSNPETECFLLTIRNKASMSPLTTSIQHCKWPLKSEKK